MSERWFRRNRMKFASGSAIAVGALAAAPAADAATFPVTNLNDNGPGSLRDAIDQANLAAGADDIIFQAGLSGTITLTTGELEIYDGVTISGPGATQLAVSGNDLSRVLYVDPGLANPDNAVTISGLTLTEGSADFGGAVANNTADLTLGAVAITDSTAAFFSGGGVASFAPLTVVDSTISGNTAEPGVEGNGVGGGIARKYADTEIVNSTISGNTAVDGGGVYSCYCQGVTDIRSSTIADNDATGAGGGIYRSFSQGNANTVNLDSTIVADNTAPTGPDLFESGTGANSRFTAGFSLVEDPSGAVIVDSPGANIFGADPALGGLAPNGGQTQTHLPASGSAAVDKGLSPGLASDQRGLTRVADDAGTANAPGGDGSDIGSVERPASGGGNAPNLGGPIVGEKNKGRLCLGQRATIVGTTGKDKIEGTSGVDVIRGMRGNDVIKGIGGDDVICGDRGEDLILTGSGNDKARGGNQADVIRGDTGNDELRGGSGRDRIFGEDGDDAMFGGAKQGKIDPAIAESRGKGVGNRCDGGSGTDTVDGCENVLRVP